MIQIDRDRPMPPMPRLTHGEATAAGKAAARARREAAGEPEPRIDPAKRSMQTKRGRAKANARKAWAELREAHAAKDGEWYHAALADLRAAVQRAADVAAGW